MSRPNTCSFTFLKAEITLIMMISSFRSIEAHIYSSIHTLSKYLPFVVIFTGSGSSFATVMVQPHL